jgi:hypothetical protein
VTGSNVTSKRSGTQKNKNSGKMESTAVVHDTKGKDANAGSTATACNTGGKEMDTGGTACHQNPKQKLPKYAHPNEGDHNLPGIEKSPLRHTISPSRIKKQKTERNGIHTRERTRSQTRTFPSSLN